MSGTGEVLREVERLRASMDQLYAVTEKNRVLEEQVFNALEARLVARRQRRAEVIAVVEKLSQFLDALPDMIARHVAAAHRERGGRDARAG